MKISRRRALASVASAAVLPGLGLKAASADVAPDPRLTPEEARSIAHEVFLWGMHPVAIYHLRYNFAQNRNNPRAVGVNRFHWDPGRAKAMPRWATKPNATTVYGMAMLDLSKDAVVVTTAPIADRYWSIQFFDNYARWWHMMGSQFDVPGPVKRLLVGPNWKGGLPDGFLGSEVVQAPSDFSGVGARIAQIEDTEADLAKVHAAQDGITLMSLGDWTAAGAITVKAADVPADWPDYPSYPGMEAVVEPGRLSAMDFLRWVGLVLKDPTFTKQPDGHREIVAFSRFERLGLKPGAAFDPDQLSPEIAAAVQTGIEDARRDVLAISSENFGIERNGWIFVNDIGYQDTDWRLRAYYGLTAILTPVPAASHLGAFCFNDSEGRPLSGEHRYTITFRMDDLPPVSEFWEIPLYDPDGYFYDNPIDRYTINSYMLASGELHVENGELVIHIRHDEPADQTQRRNWLPAPAGGFEFAARFYGPATQVIDGRYDMPGVVRLE